MVVGCTVVQHLWLDAEVRKWSKNRNWNKDMFSCFNTLDIEEYHDLEI